MRMRRVGRYLPSPDAVSVRTTGEEQQMPQAKIRLLVADVDGTLVTQEKILTERSVAAVQELRAAGVLFAVTSGRPPRGMSMLIEPLRLSTPIAAFKDRKSVV